MKAQEFLTALEEALEVPPGTIKPTDALKDLGCWDSMAALIFMALADQKLQVSVSGAEMQSCQTVPDLLSLLGSKITP